MLCRYRIDARFRAFCRLTRKGNALYHWPCGSPTDGIPQPRRGGVAREESPSLNGYIMRVVWWKKTHTPSRFTAWPPMSPQSQPAVSHSLSQLERCSPELLERIALLVTEERFLGPPSDLLALLTTSKTVNFALSPKNNNSLYAKVFALKFDIAAAKRRLTPRWLTSKCLATELRLRFAALRRIRGGIVDHTFRDLWTVFFILLEHDHKNALQLTEWAGAHTYANLVAERWLNGSYGPEFGEQAGGIVCTIIRELVREGQSFKTCVTLDDCFNAVNTS